MEVMDIEKEFRTYLEQKHIDPEAFRKHEPERWQAFLTLFGQVSPKSFTQQKLFLINTIRRRYHLPEPPKPEKTKVSRKKGVRKPNTEEKRSESGQPRRTVRKPRPKIRIKPKSKPDEKDTTAPDSPREE